MSMDFRKTAAAILSVMLVAASGQAAPKPSRLKPVILKRSDFRKPHAGIDGCRFDAAGNGPVRKAYVVTSDLPPLNYFIPPKTAFFDLGRNSDVVVVSGENVTVSGKDMNPVNGDGKAFLLRLQGGQATLMQMTDELIEACSERQQRRHPRRHGRGSGPQF